MREFQTAEELLTHYDAVRIRLYGQGRQKNAPVVYMQPKLEIACPEPSKAQREVFPDVETLPPLIINPTIGMPPEDFVPPPKTKISWSEVVVAVEKETNMRRADILGSRRTLVCIRPRHLLWALAYTCCPHMSVAEIGRRSGRDHTTILHGYKRGMEHPAYEKLKAELMSRLEAVPELEGEGA